jgi:hypothetical protein
MTSILKSIQYVAIFSIVMGTASAAFAKDCTDSLSWDNGGNLHCNGTEHYFYDSNADACLPSCQPVPSCTNSRAPQRELANGGRMQCADGYYVDPNWFTCLPGCN